MRVGLIGPFGGGNLGDAAIQEAVIGNLDRRGDFEFIAICGEPDGATAEHGIDALPISSGIWEPGKRGRLGTWLREWRFLGYVSEVVASLDMLVFSGGGQFDDYWGGPWAHPWAIYAWSRAAKRAGKPVAIASVGVDNLGRLSSLLLKGAVKCCDYVSLRDQGSLDIAAMRGIVSPDVPVVPDLAYGMATIDEIGRAAFANGGPTRIGISPISVKALGSIGALRYESYLRSLEDFAVRRLGDGSRVILFVSQTKMDLEPQLELAGKIGERVDAERRQRLDVRRVTDLPDLRAAIESCDLVVASRLHSLLLSHAYLRPTVALSYLRKVDQLMHDAGLGEYNLDLSQFSGDELDVAVQLLEADWSTAVTRLSDTILKCQQSQRLQYDIIAALPAATGV